MRCFLLLFTLPGIRHVKVCWEILTVLMRGLELRGKHLDTGAEMFARRPGCAMVGRGRGVTMLDGTAGADPVSISVHFCSTWPFVAPSGLLRAQKVKRSGAKKEGQRGPKRILEHSRA